MPSSSSHALVGGLIGAGISKGGFAVLGWTEDPHHRGVHLPLARHRLRGRAGNGRGNELDLRKTPPAAPTATCRPLRYLSAAPSASAMEATTRRRRWDHRRPLVFARVSRHHLSQGPPDSTWIVLSCYAAMGLGTLSGGWRIVKTMGMRLTKLRSHGGFSAEIGGATAVFLATALGIPVSTTHTITGAIVGAGAVSNQGRVRWGIAAGSSGPGSSPSRRRQPSAPSPMP
jgi:PiT family inorganic phosphate transporter